MVLSITLGAYHPFGNARMYESNNGSDRIGSQLPSPVQSILIQKCADCHSNHTRAPLYGHFAPVSWLMERDIVRARSSMDLSAWSSYPAEEQRVLLAKIVHETNSGEMPPLQYRLVHWGSRITDSDLQVFRTLTSNVDRAPVMVQVGSADPAHGKELFNKQCTGCHSLSQNHEGPTLQGVYGRSVGIAAGFAYSDALKKVRFVWDEAALDRWLSDPDAFVPGNAMDFSVPNPQSRRDIISYLRQNPGN
ncbi:c-type cytochrome [Acidobacteria bacterium AB60]|nr:c-type cytochrome [Acidobacteria bacterium AB60]